MNEINSLNKINPGEKCIVEGINLSGSMRRRLLDIGLVSETVVECLGKSPGGDPKAFLIRGAVIALRDDDSKNICIRALKLRES